MRLLQKVHSISRNAKYPMVSMQNLRTRGYLRTDATVSF